MSRYFVHFETRTLVLVDEVPEQIHNSAQLARAKSMRSPGIERPFPANECISLTSYVVSPT